MPNARLKLLTFDAVNTIIRVNPCPSKQYAEVANKFGLKVDEQNIKDTYEKSWSNMKLQFPNYGKDKHMTSQDWWKVFITKVFTDAGYSDHVNVSRFRMETICNDLYRNFGTKDSWMVVDGVEEMLPEFRSAGFKLAVISNFDERLSLVLDSLRLRNHFDFIVTSVSAQAEKPDTLIFRHALKQAGVSPEESIHIGDSLEEDFIPAKSLGIQPYLLVDDIKLASTEVSTVVLDQFLVDNFKAFKDIILNR